MPPWQQFTAKPIMLYRYETIQNRPNQEKTKLVNDCDWSYTLTSLNFLARLLIVLVIEAFTPSMCVPPSTV